MQGEQLRDVLFPIGHYTKEHVRELAAERFRGLAVLTKPESMGMCFIGKRRSLSNFLGSYMDFSPGRYTVVPSYVFKRCEVCLTSCLFARRFVDIDTGAVVGKHKGKEFLTIGQGARISGLQGGGRYYVAAKEVTLRGARGLYFHNLLSSSGRYGPRDSDVFVANGADHPLLRSHSLSIPYGNFNWIGGSAPNGLQRTLRTVSLSTLDSEDEAPILGSDAAQSRTLYRCSCRDRYNEPLLGCRVELLRVEEQGGAHSHSGSASRMVSAISGSSSNSEFGSSVHIKIWFDTPARSVTPGQILVLYDGDVCLGGGVIQ